MATFVQFHASTLPTMLGSPFKMPINYTAPARVVAREPFAHSVARALVEGTAFCRVAF
jgi:hypothetical protein